MSKTVATNVAANLQHLRAKRGLTKRALALASGLEESFYGKVERGERNASMPGYEALAKALGVSLVALFAPNPRSVPGPASVKAPSRGGGGRKGRAA